MIKNDSAVSKKPNILVIHADQHRYDCIGAYGNKDIKTPNMDRLAADGVLYRNSFCPYPVCAPSRYSLLTGLYVHQHLGWSNHCTLPSGLDTFPKLLKSSGYKTKAVGKMHFTPTYLDVGFKEMILAEQHGPGRHDDDYHRYLRGQGLIDRSDLEDQVEEYRNKASTEYWTNFGALPSDLEEQYHSTTWIADRGMEVLDRWTDEGNLLMVGFIKPHHPFDPPYPWYDMYSPKDLALLPGWTDDGLEADQSYCGGHFLNSKLDEKSLRRIMSCYYASISQIDYHIGRMMGRLKEKGLYDGTAIIYTSDHGDYMDYHHMILKANHLYDPLVKIPLIVKYPEGFSMGKASDSLVSNVDIAPAVLELAGLEPGRDMSGYSLLKEDNVRQAVFAEDRREYMVRTRYRKFLYNTIDDEQCMFFNLEKDPYELENLYKNPEYAGEIREMKERLLVWRLEEAKTPLNCDERANIIRGRNVPGFDDGHWEESDRYFRKKMKE